MGISGVNAARRESAQSPRPAVGLDALGRTCSGVCYFSMADVTLRQALTTLVFASTLLLGTEPAAAQPRSEPTTAQAGARRAEERRRLFVGIVGTSALILGLVGLWLSLRRRQRQPEPEEAAPPLPGSSAAPRRPEPAPRQPTPRVHLCPTCLAEYPASELFCSRDGNRLVPRAEGTDTGPAGGICPACGQGYDPGILVCPLHDEELVPAPLARAAGQRLGSCPKICPTCGVQYRNGSGFCGADGSALVTMN